VIGTGLAAAAVADGVVAREAGLVGGLALSEVVGREAFPVELRLVSAV